jgi:hypothetical protein
MPKTRPETSTRLNTLLEAFFIKQYGIDNFDVIYDKEACIENLINVKLKVTSKYPYRYLIVSRDKVFITDNPPKNLDNFILYEDIIEINVVN